MMQSHRKSRKNAVRTQPRLAIIQDGVNDFISGGGYTDTTGNGVTMDYWINLYNATQNSAWQVMLNTPSCQFLIRFLTQDIQMIIHPPDFAFTDGFIHESIVGLSWLHITIVKKPTYIKVYLNRILYMNKIIAPANYYNGFWNRLEFGTGICFGKYTTARIWNRELTQVEVTANWTAGKIGVPEQNGLTHDYIIKGGLFYNRVASAESIAIGNNFTGQPYEIVT